MTTLLVIAKEPVTGKVKTRLPPPFTAREAAAPAEAALADTLDAALRTPPTGTCWCSTAPPDPGYPPGSRSVPDAPAAST